MFTHAQKVKTPFNYPKIVLLKNLNTGNTTENLSATTEVLLLVNIFNERHTLVVINLNHIKTVVLLVYNNILLLYKCKKLFAITEKRILINSHLHGKLLFYLYVPLMSIIQFC